MVDQTTGDIYCTWIANGEWVKIKGSCDQTNNDNQNTQTQTDQTNINNPPTSTEASIGTGATTTVASTSTEESSSDNAMTTDSVGADANTDASANADAEPPALDNETTADSGNSITDDQNQDLPPATESMPEASANPGAATPAE